MKIVEPEVYHLAGTTMDYEGGGDFLRHHGIEDWDTDAASAAERLIEMAGRRCYQSWETPTQKVSDKNPNLSRVRKGNLEYIGNILKVQHGSVIEHAYDTFAIENVSRVFTHEIVRHRLCNFSQESLRFVRPTSLNAYFPDAFANIEDEGVRMSVEAVFRTTFEDLEAVQKVLVGLLGMDTVKRAFHDKKMLQSSMRRLMPIGLSTGIIVTTNHRHWRHMITFRTARSSEEEIRKVFVTIAAQLALLYPALYQDMRRKEVDGISELTFEYGRV